MSRRWIPEPDSPDYYAQWFFESQRAEWEKENEYPWTDLPVLQGIEETPLTRKESV